MYEQRVCLTNIERVDTQAFEPTRLRKEHGDEGRGERNRRVGETLLPKCDRSCDSEHVIDSNLQQRRRRHIDPRERQCRHAAYDQHDERE